MSTLTIALLLIIAGCIVSLVKAAIEVRSWWRAWKLEEMKRQPVIGSTEKHIDLRG